VVGLSRLLIADARDFTYAVALSRAPAALGWSHLEPDGFRLGIWALDPQPRALADVPLNEVSHDVEALDFSPDGTMLAAASRDGKVRLFERATGRLVKDLSLGEPLSAIAWSPDGRCLAVGSAAGLIALLCGPELRTCAVERIHTGEVRAVAFDAAGHLFSGGWDRTIAKLAVACDQPQQARLEQLERFEFPLFVNDLSVDHSGSRLGVAFGEQPAVRTYEIYLHEKRGIQEPASEGNCAAIVDAASGTVLRRFALHRGVVSTAAISPDGRSLASGGWDGKLYVLSGDHAEPIFDDTFGWSVRRARFSGDGRYLAVGAWTPQRLSGDSAPAAIVYDVRYAPTPERASTHPSQQGAERNE
jgi:WD40 repeat protein